MASTMQLPWMMPQSWVLAQWKDSRLQCNLLQQLPRHSVLVALEMERGMLPTNAHAHVRKREHALADERTFHMREQRVASAAKALPLNRWWNSPLSIVQN